MKLKESICMHNAAFMHRFITIILRVSAFYNHFEISFTMPPPYINHYTMSPLEKINVCGSFIFIYWLIFMLFCQSIDVVITNDTFYWFLLSKFPLSQSEASLDKSRSRLLECAIHVFNSVSLCPPFLL